VRAADLNDVFPILRLRCNPVAQRRHSWQNRFVTLTAAAIFIAVGKESLEDCDILT
jgi:hypothetical protein